MDQLRHGRSSSVESEVTNPESGIDRRQHLRRIRHLAEGHYLQWLVDQETWQVGSPRNLNDEQLVALLQKVEHAVECFNENIPYADAGLYRAVSR